MNLKQFVGKKFGDVETALLAELKKEGLSLLINSPDSPRSIDVDHHRATVYVDEDFIIRMIGVR